MRNKIFILFGIIFVLKGYSQTCIGKNELIEIVVQQINTRDYIGFKTLLNRKIIEKHTSYAAGEDKNSTDEDVKIKIQSIPDNDFYESIIKGFKASNNSISETVRNNKWKIKKYKLKKSKYIPSLENVFAYDLKFKVGKNYFTINLLLIEVESCFYFQTYPGLVEISNK